MKLHHIGYACKDIQRAVSHFKSHINIIEISPIFYDSFQDAEVCMLTDENGNRTELVSGNKVKNILDKDDEIKFYHTAYEVENLEERLNSFLQEGALQVSEIKPAIIFSNRRVVFLQTTAGLIELVETGDAMQADSVLVKINTHPLLMISNFIIDPISPYVRKLLDESALNFELKYESNVDIIDAIYSLDSSLNKNTNGYNFIFIKLTSIFSHEGVQLDKKEKFKFFVDALNKLVRNSTIPVQVFICPEPLDKAMVELIEKIKEVQGIILTNQSDILSSFDGEKIYDHESNLIASVPYNEEFYAHLGFCLVKNIPLFFKKSYKVVVVDCDNTLWDGSVIEDGLKNIHLSDERIRFQSFLKLLVRKGVILVIASKNDKDDIELIFKQPNNMPLCIDDFYAIEANWGEKSESILKISKDLNILTDDFLFIDDNILECNEVQNSIPGLSVLNFPSDESKIPGFLEYINYFFDLSQSSMGAKRLKFYKENLERNKLLEFDDSPENYVKSLQLKLNIIILSLSHSNDISRFSEMTYRVNQFNLTQEKFSIKDTIGFLKNQGGAFLVEMTDRFGDYGIVGAVYFKEYADSIDILGMFVSCRAFMRGVEHALLSKVVEYCISANRNKLIIYFRESEKNEPAANFIKSLHSFVDQKIICEDGMVRYELNKIALSSLKFRPSTKQVSRKPIERQLNFSKIDFLKSNYIITMNQFKNSSHFFKLFKDNKPKGGGANTSFSNYDNHFENEIKMLLKNHLNLEFVPSLEDNFFSMGGNSLSAVRFLSLLYKKFPVKLSLIDFLKAPTIDNILSNLKIYQDQDNKHHQEMNLALSPDNEVVPATYNEYWMWLNKKISGFSWHYNLPYSYKIKGRLNVQALEHALRKIVQINPILRTIFFEDNGIVYSKTLNHFVPNIEIFYINNETENIEGLINDFYKFEFDFSALPLFKIGLFQDQSNEILAFNFHHIIFDAISYEIFKRELEKFYFDGLNGKNVEVLTKKHLSNTNYLNTESNQSYKFWQSYLSDVAPLSLPLDKQRQTEVDYKGKFLRLYLPEETLSNLTSVAKKLDISLFSIFCSSMNVLLAYFCNTKDTQLCVSVSGREPFQDDEIIQFFSNVIMLKMKLRSDELIEDYLKRGYSGLLEIFEHQHTPFYRAMETLEIERVGNHHPLCQVMLTFLDENHISSPNLAGVDSEYYRYGYDSARMDLVFEIINCQKETSIGLYYNDSIFYESTANALLDMYIRILGEIPKNLHNGIDSLLECEFENRKRLQFGLKEELLYENLFLFLKDSFLRNSSSIAIQHGDQKIYYFEVVENIAKLEKYILENISLAFEVGYVIIDLPRGIDLIISILTVLKIGYAFVALDQKNTYSFKNNIIDEVKPIFIITDGLGTNRNDYPCINISKPNISPKIKYNSKISSHFKQEIAYLIFTSGSSGSPKGVKVTHKNIINLAQWSLKQYSNEEFSSTLFSSSIAFDLSMFEIFCTLASGGKIVVVQDVLELIDSKDILDITLLNTVPTSAQLLLQNNAIPNTVKVINLAGEMLPFSLVKELYKLSSVEKIYNLYAPAETTTYSTVKLLIKQSYDKPSIGKPILNTSVRILNDQNKEVGIGKIGELCIGGFGVTDGYLNNDELTQQRFINNKDNGDYRIYYKTGDLARYLMNGDLELLGRADHEVKISGYRINLNSIESTLIESSLVKLAVVVVISDPSDLLKKYLYAFVTPINDRLRDENLFKALKNYLGRKLPYYMMPMYIKSIDVFPVLPSGKIDKVKLAELAKDISYKTTLTEDMQDFSQLEGLVYKAWTDILFYKKFDRNTNFFDAGGNSILIVELYNKLKTYVSEYSYRLVDLFVYPTIASFADYLRSQSVIDDNVGLSAETDRCAESMDIALIGYACRFPKSENFDQYWDNIKNGIDCISRFRRDELEKGEIDIERLNHNDLILSAGVVDNIYGFDYDFFDISPAEAALLDPQHRIFLELCWEALEVAGCIPNKFNGNIGVFAGNGINQYGRKLLEVFNNFNNEVVEMQFNLSQEKDYLSTRVAYKLGLNGAALNINTACSTSLVAIVKACQSLFLRETDVAIAGGVSLVLPENFGYFFAKDHVFSKSGTCRPFDQFSDGTVPSSGAGVVVLKRLKDAIKDHDNICGVIRGYSLNNDGNKKVSFTAPSPAQQINCIKNAYQQARINAADISYIEAHGTGTQLGDPIEITALNKVFENKTLSTSNECAIGSVKSNIGHTDAAAGVAGLLKIIGMLQHQQIPPQIHFSELNKRIVLNKGFYINSSLKPWDAGNRKRIAAISSFGLGGTNAHIVVEEYQTNKTIPITQNSTEIILIVLSAKTKDSLMEVKNDLLNFLTDIDTQKRTDYLLKRIAFTLQTGRENFSHRYACFCKSIDELICELQSDEEMLKSISRINGVNGSIEKRFQHAYINWIAGNDINWEDLYGTEKIEKITLPTYPFMRKKCKLSFSEKNKNFGDLDVDGTLPVKSSIKNIWSSLLGIEDIDDESDFFALGGQSITMLRMLVNIDKHYGVRLSYGQAFKNKKFRDFLSLVEKTIDAQVKFAKIELLKTGEAPAIILIHPGNGELFAYHEISTTKNLNNAIYGISNPLLGVELSSETSIEQLSLEYIKLIDSIDAETFILAGWSFGGTVAYELAQHLSSSTRLQGVILLDSWAYYPEEFNNDEHFQEIVKLYNETNDSSDYLAETLAGLRNRMQLLREYKPQKADFRVVLLKASDKRIKSDDETNFFGKHVDDIRTLYVDGDHDSILNSKYTATFLEAFCSAIKHLNNS